MKILLISDCHANVDALHALWEKESNCDAIVFAGDMVDYGFYPKETVQWFMERKDRLYAVLGNHDQWILEHHHLPVAQGPPETFQQLTFQQLGQTEYDFLASLPHERTFTLGDTDFYLCHTPDELSQEVCYPEMQLAVYQLRGFALERLQTKFPTAAAPNKMLVFGHSHLQWVASAGEAITVVNPGSLSYRFGTFEEVRCADYAVWEDGAFFLRHVNFNTRHLYQKAVALADQEASRLGKAFYREIE